LELSASHSEVYESQIMAREIKRLSEIRAYENFWAVAKFRGNNEKSQIRREIGKFREWFELQLR